jgi:predicted MFS family arabinose efflux permease
MGISNTKSQLLSVPPYLVAAMVCVGASFLSDRLKTRGFIMLAISPLIVIGFAIMATVKSTAIRYFAIFLATTGAFTCSPILLAWVVSNSAGPSVRAIVTSYSVGIANIGGIIATWTYLPSDAPGYTTGHWINFGAGILLITVVTFTTFYLKLENKKRMQGRRDDRVIDATPDEINRLGHSHPLYRYTA